MMTKRFLTKLPLATFREMWYSPPFLGHHAGVSAPALFQPLSLDCGLGGKQKSHRVYSLSQVPGASEFVSYFWHFYSSPRSCCHLTALHVSQSEGLTRFFKWFHHCVAGRGKQLKWREINFFFCSRSKHSTQIDPSTSSYSEIIYHPLLWGVVNSCLLLFWGRRLPVSCRGVAVVVHEGLFLSSARKKVKGMYGHGNW